MQVSKGQVRRRVKQDAEDNGFLGEFGLGSDFKYRPLKVLITEVASFDL